VVIESGPIVYDDEDDDDDDGLGERELDDLVYDSDPLLNSDDDGELMGCLFNLTYNYCYSNRWRRHFLTLFTSIKDKFLL
jgi:hypothetical protein